MKTYKDFMPSYLPYSKTKSVMTNMKAIFYPNVIFQHLQEAKDSETDSFSHSYLCSPSLLYQFTSSKENTLPVTFIP